MAYDEYQAERIHRILDVAKVNYFAKKMMGGLVFMVNDKMACGVMFNKKKESDLLMVRANLCLAFNPPAKSRKKNKKVTKKNAS